MVVIDVTPYIVFYIELKLLVKYRVIRQLCLNKCADEDQGENQ